ncbi:MAG: hypothetical protein HY680_10550, partial [Chloroflexi bacterium]|nr:hypothetical protein [Chloroflexota bacterium]
MEDQLARLAKEVNTYFDAVSLTGGKNHLMDSPCPDISWQIPHLVPEGSTAMPAKSPGTCVPCGQKYSKNRLLVRALSWDAYSE